MKIENGLKRILLLSLVLVLVFSTITGAFASTGEVLQTSNVYTVVVNEYDVLTNLQSYSDKELVSYGYTTNEAKEIRDISIEEALLKRASLPEEELYSLGYNEYQIKLLKAYDGSPVTENSAIRGVFADLTGSVSKVSASDSSAKARFNWQWSNSPVFSGTVITEYVTCGFVGVNVEGDEYLMAPTGKSCTVKYYDGNTLMTYTAPTVNETNPWKEVKTTFPMGKIVNGTSCWAKEGSMLVELTEEILNNEMDCAAFLFNYCHTAIQVSDPIITIGVSFIEKKLKFDASVTITGGPTEMFRNGIIIQSDGSSREFTGEE